MTNLGFNSNITKSNTNVVEKKRKREKCEKKKKLFQSVTDLKKGEKSCRNIEKMDQFEKIGSNRFSARGGFKKKKKKLSLTLNRKLERR